MTTTSLPGSTGRTAAYLSACALARPCMPHEVEPGQPCHTLHLDDGLTLPSVCSRRIRDTTPPDNDALDNILEAGARRRMARVQQASTAARTRTPTPASRPEARQDHPAPTRHLALVCIDCGADLHPTREAPRLPLCPSCLDARAERKRAKQVARVAAAAWRLSRGNGRRS